PYPPKAKAAGKVAAGKAANVEAGRKAVVVAVGGVIYRVPFDGEGGEVDRLGGDVGQSLALAGGGPDGAVVYAFQTGEKPEKAVMIASGGKPPSLFRWP